MTISFPNPFKRKTSPDVPTYDHRAQVKQFTESSASDHLAFYGQVSSNVKQPAAKETHMSFKSVLSDIGHVAEKIFTLGLLAAKSSEPYIAAFFPGVSPLFNSITTAVGNAETAAIAAGKQDGTGAQKLALVSASIQDSIAAYEKANGITTPMTQAQIEAAVNGVVAFLNALPATSQPAPTAVSPTV